MTSLTVSSPVQVPRKKPVPSLSIGAGSNPYDRTVFAKRHSQFFKITANRWLSKTHAVDGFTITFKQHRAKHDDNVLAYDWIQKGSEPGSPFSPDDKDIGVP
jgi:hypothetical protein